MTFWVLIIEKHCLDIFIFPFFQLFSSTITAIGESNKEIVFFVLLCNRSGILSRLLPALTQTESFEASVHFCSKTASWHFFILCSWWTGFSPVFSVVGIYSVGTSIKEYGATYNKFWHVSKDDRIKFLAVIPMDVDMTFKKLLGRSLQM